MKSTDYNVALNHFRVLLVRASAVKSYRRFLLPSLLLSFISIALPATARADKIKITNELRERVKVCVYDATDRVAIFPSKCWTIDAGKTAVWDRGKEEFTFNARVFRPSLIDDHICSGIDLTQDFHIDASRKPCRVYTLDPVPAPEPPPAAQPKPAPAPAKKYTLRVCNTTGATVQFALGYPINDFNFVGEGWWLVSKGDCMNIAMSEIWKAQGIMEGVFAPTYIYAKSGQLFQQIWEGTGDDLRFCINQKKAFEIRQFEIKNRRLIEFPCEGTNLELVKFLKVPWSQVR
ncbi:MAG: DUF1036 domain-containing protein [Pyrinomonadaceae bacterium]